MNLKMFLILLKYSILVLSVNANSETLVKVDDVGDIRGSIMTSVHGREFLAFRGIPFAEPPVGQLRFKPPVPKKPWVDSDIPFDATEDGPECVQYAIVNGDILGQEDCLVLNVYTHSTNQNLGSSDPRAVMVFIHGGGLIAGSGSSQKYGPRKLLDKDVVLVTINYRLNAFGFLSTGDEESPGNYGFLDQLEALKWVKKNIQAFGGDSNRITIIGESAGSASVYYQILSPLSKGLFNGAIAMSGTPIALWATTRINPSDYVKQFGTCVECPTSDSKQLVNCLRELPPIKIIEMTGLCFINTPIPFAPVVDGHFLLDHPTDLFQRGDIANRVPLLTGITKDEGIFFYVMFRQTSEPYTLSKLGRIVKFAMNTEINDEQLQAVKNYYKDEIKNDYEVKVICQIFGECMYDAPHYETVKYLTQYGLNPYIYSFDYSGSNDVGKLLGVNLTGVGHAQDLYFLFQGPTLFPGYKDVEDPGTYQFLDYWVNFAKFGNPTPPEAVKEGIMKWEPATSENIPVYHLDNSVFVATYNMNGDTTRDFWMKLKP